VTMIMEVVVLLLRLCLVLWWWQARVMLGWHKEALYCGRCGSKTLSYLSGQRRVCSKCNNKLYPRIDPVRILSLSTRAVLSSCCCMHASVWIWDGVEL
jgi:NADH pyrophosphatase NudC (nudix superfamily)